MWRQFIVYATIKIWNVSGRLAPENVESVVVKNYYGAVYLFVIKISTVVTPRSLGKVTPYIQTSPIISIEGRDIVTVLTRLKNLAGYYLKNRCCPVSHTGKIHSIVSEGCIRTGSLEFVLNASSDARDIYQNPGYSTLFANTRQVWISQREICQSGHGQVRRRFAR